MTRQSCYLLDALKSDMMPAQKAENMEFTTAEKSDIAELTDLRIAYLKEDFGTLTSDDEQKLRQQIPAYFEKHLNKDAIAFVAKDKSGIAAVALLIIEEKPANPNFIHGKTGEVLSVYTKPEHRRNGYSSKLISMLTDYARQNSIDRVDLLATKLGRPVYKKAGFNEYKSEYVAMRFTLK